MSNPKPSLLFLFINSFHPGSFSDWLHYQNKSKISNLQKATPPPTTIAFLLNATCKMYFTSLWINAVLNIWIGNYKRTDAEQQLERLYIVRGMRSFLFPGLWALKSIPRYFIGLKEIFI